MEINQLRETFILPIILSQLRIRGPQMKVPQKYSKPALAISHQIITKLHLLRLCVLELTRVFPNYLQCELCAIIIKDGYNHT